MMRRVGLGWRPEIATELALRPAVVDFVEVVAETCYTQRATRREACALAEIWPVIPHGVKLSLGSADGVDLDRARRLGALAKELRAPFISEHVSFSRAGEVEIGHLTQLPRTREAIAVVAANVERVKRVLPDVPLYLENVAWSFLWPDAEMDEATFYQEVVAATGCKLLLDLSNLYANAVNEGLDPIAVVRKYPLEAVGMVHVAGGVREHGFYYDTHAHAVPSAVFALVAELVTDAPILIERDANFDFAELERELATLRALEGREGERGAAAPDPAVMSRTPVPAVSSTSAGAGTALAPAATAAAAATGSLSSPTKRGPGRSPASDRAIRDTDRTSTARLAIRQREIAGQLVRGEPPTMLAAQIGKDPMDRSRSILQRKRVDDALPLVANLALRTQHAQLLHATATTALASAHRPASGAGPADAWRIATACLAVPELADAAAIDLLLLRARFTGPRSDDGTLSPRTRPFIGSTRTTDGRRIRATKGLGARAQVRIQETRTT